MSTRSLYLWTTVCFMTEFRQSLALILSNFWKTSPSFHSLNQTHYNILQRLKEKFSHIDQVFSKLIVALRKGWLSKKKNNAPAVASSGILVEFKLLLFRGSPDTISDFWKLGQSYSFFSVLLYNCTSDIVYKIFNTRICFEVGCEYRRLKNFSRFRRADLGSRPTRYSQGTYGIWQPPFSILDDY